MTETTETIDSCSGNRRHAAGENPAKRDQIIDGARKVFMEKGFDAASMNDICRAAGVSKGTLYVYFADKVELFEAMIARERVRFFDRIQGAIDLDAPLDERLRRVAHQLVHILTSPNVIRAQRIVIGAADKMPELGVRFYTAGARAVKNQLSAFFDREVQAGRLAIPDTTLASQQFIEITAGVLWKPRIFSAVEGQPTEDEISRVADSAVKMFLAAYGAA